MSHAAPQQLSLWPEDEDAVSSPALGSPVDGVARSRAEHGGLQAAVCTLPCFRHPRADREIHFSKAIVAYEFKRVSRRSIGMVVGVEGLSVRAPRWVAIRDVEMALRAKERWICKKLGEQRERAHRQQAARIDWCEGASVPFLGESLVVVLEPGLKAPILRDGHAAQTGLPGVAQRALHVGLPQETPPEKIRDTVLAWMRHHARGHFSARVQHYAEQLQNTD